MLFWEDRTEALFCSKVIWNSKSNLFIHIQIQINLWPITTFYPRTLSIFFLKDQFVFNKTESKFSLLICLPNVRKWCLQQLAPYTSALHCFFDVNDVISGHKYRSNNEIASEFLSVALQCCCNVLPTFKLNVIPSFKMFLLIGSEKSKMLSFFRLS